MREANEGWAAYVTELLADRYDGNATALAKALDVSPSTITRWIDGATPEIARLKQLSRIEKIPMVTLLVAAGALESETLAEPEVRPVGDISENVLDLTPLEEQARAHLVNQYQFLREWSDQTASKKTQRPLRAVARRRPRRDQP